LRDVVATLIRLFASGDGVSEPLHRVDLFGLGRGRRRLIAAHWHGRRKAVVVRRLSWGGIRVAVFVRRDCDSLLVAEMHHTRAQDIRQLEQRLAGFL
jgi:hypothetical protein